MATEAASPKPRRFIVLVPLVLFLGLGGALPDAASLGPRRRRNSLGADRTAGARDQLPPLEGMALPGIDSKNFAGKVTLVNVWASWCAPCREEHPLLLALSQDKRFGIAGLNYKDAPENARRFLGSLGNPYAAIGVDQAGRAAIDWGVYGVPETFLVGKDGKILFKHVGPLTEEAVTGTLLPEIEKALAAG